MLEFRDRPPAGWFVLGVMRQRKRGWDWAALMIDVDPDDYPHRTASAECWVRIPGRHRTQAAACEALDDMMAARH